MPYRDARISESCLDQRPRRAGPRGLDGGPARGAELRVGKMLPGLGDLVPYAKIDGALAADRCGYQAAASVAP